MQPSEPNLSKHQTVVKTVLQMYSLNVIEDTTAPGTIYNHDLLKEIDASESTKRKAIAAAMVQHFSKLPFLVVACVSRVTKTTLPLFLIAATNPTAKIPTKVAVALPTKQVPVSVKFDDDGSTKKSTKRAATQNAKYTENDAFYTLDDMDDESSGKAVADAAKAATKKKTKTQLPPPAPFASAVQPPILQHAATNAWTPGILRRNYLQMSTNRKVTVLTFQLMSGATTEDDVTFNVAEDGWTLKVESKVPEILFEEKLETLHSDEVTSRDHDYYFRTGALHTAAQEMKQLWSYHDGAYFWVTNVALDFPCNQEYKLLPKADLCGMVLAYIILWEKGTTTKKGTWNLRYIGL
jgi:hypothetical protein